MATQRNFFIISKSFGHFFKASIIIALAEQLNQILDLVLVGNMIASEAFAALDLAIPIETAITGLLLLLIGGGGTIACRYIGDQEFELANRVQTISVLSSAFLAAFFSIFGLAFLKPIVSLICSEALLAEYLVEYLRVYFLGLVPMALYFSMAQIVDIDGSPMKVAKAVVIGCSLDLVCDVIFMKYLGMGVVGEALANIISYLFPVIYFVPYIRYKRCKYNFCLRRGGNKELLMDNLRQGVSFCLPYLVTFLFGFIINHLVMRRFGVDGVYVWGVAYQVLMLGFMLMDYTGKTILVTLGSMLYGCYDTDGLELLVRKVFVAACVEVVILLSAVWIFPDQVVAMFGDHSGEFLKSSIDFVKIAVLFLIPYTFCCIKVYTYQVLERRLGSVLQLLSLMGFTTVFLVVVPWEGVLGLGMALAAAYICFLIWDFVYSFIARRSDPDLKGSFLIPHREMHLMLLSIQKTTEGMNEALPQIEQFLNSCQVDDSMRFGINICCEELILGVVTHCKEEDRDAVFDFLIYEDDGGVKVRVQDVADPFNPVKHFTKTAAEAYLAGEEMHLSLQIINKICKQLKYNYLYEQNTIYMAFKA